MTKASEIDFNKLIKEELAQPNYSWVEETLSLMSDFLKAAQKEGLIEGFEKLASSKKIDDYRGSKTNCEDYGFIIKGSGFKVRKERGFLKKDRSLVPMKNNYDFSLKLKLREYLGENGTPRRSDISVRVSTNISCKNDELKFSFPCLGQQESISSEEIKKFKEYFRGAVTSLSILDTHYQGRTPQKENAPEM